jgi:hypothetical protein
MGKKSISSSVFVLKFTQNILGKASPGKGGKFTEGMWAGNDYHFLLRTEFNRAMMSKVG